jgi:hypothetical protein
VTPDRACGPCAVLSPQQTLSEELFKFSIVSMEWTNLDAAAGVKGTGPSARGGHAMSAVGTDLYLFGGATGVSSYWVTVYWGGTVAAWYEIPKACVSMT